MFWITKEVGGNNMKRILLFACVVSSCFLFACNKTNNNTSMSTENTNANQNEEVAVNMVKTGPIDNLYNFDFKTVAYKADKLIFSVVNPSEYKMDMSFTYTCYDNDNNVIDSGTKTFLGLDAKEERYGFIKSENGNIDHVDFHCNTFFLSTEYDSAVNKYNCDLAEDSEEPLLKLTRTNNSYKHLNVESYVVYYNKGEVVDIELAADEIIPFFTKEAKIDCTVPFDKYEVYSNAYLIDKAE